MKLFFLGILVISYANAFAWETVRKVMDEAFDNKLFPGASVYVGNQDHGLYVYSVGDSDSSKIYDVASLTKAVVTTTLVMHLIEQDRLKLDDKVSKYFSTFDGGKKKHVTIEDLLRHRSGLPSGARPVDSESFKDYLTRITSADLSYTPRTKTVYSDLSFILLGFIVEMVSEKKLTTLAREIIFDPLKMFKSTFAVSGQDLERCAPTTPERKCQVHDPTAFHFLPAALGHAGLFSTLDELSIFARMILNKGHINGVRILSEATIDKMLRKDLLRGLGWDFSSEFSRSPRGETFPDGISFGHTGYTGAAIWIDPQSNTYYVLLSNRLAFGDDVTKRAFNEFRKRLSTQIGNKVYSTLTITE